MSNINLNSKEWCDIVFEDKNKEYGAYPLRRGAARRHLLALAITVAGLVVAIGGLFLIRSNRAQQTITMTQVTTLAQLPPAKKEQPVEVPKVAVPAPPPLKSSIKFTPPVIKKDELVKAEDEMKSQAEILDSKVAVSIADVKGTDEINGKDIADLKDIVQEAPSDEPFVSVEQMPSFPGGETALRQFLAHNLRYPPIAADNLITGTVVIQFVVTKTGDIDRVTVLRKVNSYLDKEAVRVVSSMPRWVPGRNNGTAANVYFVLPVVFKLEE